MPNPQQPAAIVTTNLASDAMPKDTTSPDLRDPSPSSPRSDRRGSAEWDAAKVPPSRFQKRKGSIYAVPGSRDGHVDSNYAAKFHEKHSEMWKTPSSSSSSTSKSNTGSVSGSSGGGGGPGGGGTGSRNDSL